jgi:hypothetical protein
MVLGQFCKVAKKGGGMSGGIATFLNLKILEEC